MMSYISYFKYRKNFFYEKYNLESISKILLLKDIDLAIGLAKYNIEFGCHPLAQDLDILSLKNGEVALSLAWRSDVNGWGKTPVAQRMEVFTLMDEKIVKGLAFNSDKNGWGKTDAGQKLEVLKLYGEEVAFWLADKSYKNGWAKTPAAQDKQVLKLRDGWVKKILDEYYKKGLISINYLKL